MASTGKTASQEFPAQQVPSDQPARLVRESRGLQDKTGPTAKMETQALQAPKVRPEQQAATARPSLVLRESLARMVLMALMVSLEA